MDAYGYAQIITLGLAIAVLVILIIVLTRNNLTKVSDNSGNETTTMLDNKVNWLYGLAIAEAGIVCVFGVLTLLAMMRWAKK